MADIETLSRALRRAHEAGDEAAARHLAQVLRAATDPAIQARARWQQARDGTLPQPSDERLQQQAEIDRMHGPQDQRSALYRNIFGGSPPDQLTPGEKLGRGIEDAGQSFFPGVARGAAELVGLPGTILDGLDSLAVRAGVLNEDAAPPSRISGSALRGYMSDATGGASEFRGDTRTGRIAGTIGEFVPGAAGAGPKGLLAYAVAPGAASELAGEATEGTAAEPYARLGAALGAGLLAGPVAGRPPSVRARGAGPEQRAAAEALQSAGVQPTAGQVTGSSTLRRMEGTITARPEQVEAFTRAAMRSVGSNADRATPATLRAAQKTITDTMDDALRGVSVRPTQSLARSADDVVQRYLLEAPSGSVVPRVRAIADEIMTAAGGGGKPIDLSVLRTWRSALGRMSQSNDEATRTAAHGLRRIIDSATDDALRAAGRSGDIAALSQAREQYRNFLAVSDASTRAGSNAGLLSPAQVNQSVIRTQGRDAYAVGRGTDLMETARNAESLLRSLPTVEAGGFRRLPGLMDLGSAGGGAYTGFALGGPAGAAAGGLLGLLAPSAGQAAMRSRPIQNMLMNPGYAAGSAARMAPGVLAGN